MVEEWRMKKGMRWLFGIVCLLMGTTLAAWIGYNLLVERQPAAEGLNPLPAIVFTAGLFYVGVRQVRLTSRPE